jgi:hypothetical protein
MPDAKRRQLNVIFQSADFAEAGSFELAFAYCIVDVVKRKNRLRGVFMATMDKLNSDIAKTEEKLEQLKRQKRAKEQRDKEARRKEETRLKIIIGAVVMSYFPQLQKLKPQKTNAENDAEFSKLAAFCSALADENETMARLEEKARQIMAAKQQAAATSENQ